MRFKVVFFILLFSFSSLLFSQDSKWKKFKKLSPPEKCWVIRHPFVAKKALKITEEARFVTKSVKQEKLLKGLGNGDQVDAFRHAFWMANLTFEIGRRRAKSLGESHEKGNYKDYKKRKLEDGVIPDKISSDMDLFNNDVGIEIGKQESGFNFKKDVINAVKEGRCKIVKKDKKDNFLDCEGNVISLEELKGKWENNKCLVNSNQ